MESISIIYQQFQVMPQLQTHQLRVASVAKQICEAQPRKVDTEAVIRACLIHDIANIIKFDLKQFPEFLEPQGLAYWQAVQQSYKQTYGDDEHRASMKIAANLGQPQRVVELIAGIGFAEIPAAANSTDLELKICCYADQRVSPFGVVPIQERLDEGKKRYGSRTDRKVTVDFDSVAADLVILEGQVFRQAKLVPADITNQSIVPIMQGLPWTQL